MYFSRYCVRIIEYFIIQKILEFEVIIMKHSSRKIINMLDKIIDISVVFPLKIIVLLFLYRYCRISISSRYIIIIIWFHLK